MFADYATGLGKTSSTQAIRDGRREEKGKANPYCCCCKASTTLLICNGLTALLSIGLVTIGAIINNANQEWSWSFVDMVGNLCLGTGLVILVVSMLGMIAARTLNRCIGFLYFFTVSCVAALLVLVLVVVVLEQDKVLDYIEENWDEISAAFNTELTYAEAEEMAMDYYLAILCIAALGLAILIVTFSSAMRLLGMRLVALSQLITLGALGSGTIALAVVTGHSLPSAVLWLLFGAGSVQIVCAICGLAGFKTKNRECIRALFVILLLSIGGLIYTGISSYMLLRDQDVLEDSISLLLVFAISVSCLIFNVCTLFFEMLYYLMQRRAFREADRAAQAPVHFSDNGGAKSQRSGRRRFGRRGKQHAPEFTPNAAL